MQKLDTSHLEKTNISGYYRDPKTGAILNGNEGELAAYLVARQQFREFETIKQAHSFVLDELAQIKKVLGL